MRPTLGAKWSALMAEFGGRRTAWLYVVHRLLDKISGGRVAIVPYRLVAQPVGNPALAGVRPDPGTVVRRIGPDDPVVADLPRPRAVIEQRFADGSECHVAWVKGRFAGCIWIARGHYVEDEVRCVYRIADAARGVWDYDVYVEPSLRLGRTMSRLWKAVDDTLAAEGVTWSFSRIHRFNATSMRSHERLGAIAVGDLIVLRLWAAQLSLRRLTGQAWKLAWSAAHVTLAAPD
jgi:hypothetical protein